ncbi:glutamate racemase [Alkalibacterium putridalgicola]|uniref:Glutamate racemase n=1 Tax=Alkalibacterium putridalgicola TaxID=426703 RepID=A0A1H7SIG0_9LACT|nr:glutamate racemase [Alkalibacterium putridalgicola]GEK88731.1 glutamate racemase [Alkalibacterium putridalgicola]SEL72285.1 glutamate racemase [Alkalibacterium putridalgicola]
MLNRPIGLLDSGVGGLTVLKAVKDRLPNESFVYIGDTKRCPYGNRTKEEIITFTLELVQFLLDQNVKMIVIACNTATAHALEIVRSKVDIPVIGVVGPGSRAAVSTSDSKQIGVLATVSTVESGFYEQSLLEKDGEIEVKSLACPEFVDIVEANAYESAEARTLVEEKLAGFKTPKMDTVILGCTHFPLLAPFIQEVLGQDVTLVDSGALTSYEVAKGLEKKGLETATDSKGTIQIFTTGSEARFRTIVENWLETDQLDIKSISLERLK